MVVPPSVSKRQNQDSMIARSTGARRDRRGFESAVEMSDSGAHGGDGQTRNRPFRYRPVGHRVEVIQHLPAISP
jgi:hypothetical protein